MSNEEKLLELSRSIGGLNRTCSNELLKGEKIHFGQPPIFHALLERDEQSQCDIAAAIGVSRASVGVSLRRMEKSGIVSRVINQKDSRYNLVSLTEKGAMIGKEFDKQATKWHKLLFEDIAEKDIAIVKKVFENITQKAQKIINNMEKK